MQYNNIPTPLHCSGRIIPCCNAQNTDRLLSAVHSKCGAFVDGKRHIISLKSG